MFTGIIKGIAPVVAINEQTNFRTHTIKLTDYLLQGLAPGDSVAHNGCCLTVTGINGNCVTFDLIKETLQMTNLGLLQVGDLVNMERAASLQVAIGGHLMSGHITCTAELSKIVASVNNRHMWFSLMKKNLQKYIFYKGYIGIDGISLTVNKVVKNYFCVHLIPETLFRTTLGKKQLGDLVNIEIDLQTQAVVDTVERLLATSKLAKKCFIQVAYSRGE